MLRKLLEVNPLLCPRCKTVQMEIEAWITCCGLTTSFTVTDASGIGAPKSLCTSAVTRRVLPGDETSPRSGSPCTGTSAKVRVDCAGSGAPYSTKYACDAGMD